MGIPENVARGKQAKLDQAVDKDEQWDVRVRKK